MSSRGLVHEASLTANTYTPGIAAAISRADEKGAKALYHMAYEELCGEHGLNQHQADCVLMWSMTGLAVSLLKRMTEMDDIPIEELITAITLRQHDVLAASREDDNWPWS